MALTPVFPQLEGANGELRVGEHDVLKQQNTEKLNDIVPKNFAFSPGEILRHGSNEKPGVTDVIEAIRAAILGADGQFPVVRFGDRIGISESIVIGKDTIQGLTIEGASRATSVMMPTAANVSGPDGINAMIINKINNGHLCLRNHRYLDEAAYVGKVVYAVEGAGSDPENLVQAIFSMSVIHCWFSLSTNNTGTFQGGFSNLLVTQSVFEGTKDAAFILQGAGNGDLVFTDNVHNFNYDNFIRKTDATAAGLIRVSGLQVYQHLRGRLIELVNVETVVIDGVQVSWNIANVGSCSLLCVTDCDKVIVTNFHVTDREGAVGAFGFEIDSSTVKIAHGTVIATVGVIIRGTGEVNVTIEDVDFTGCEYAVQIDGAVTGTLHTRNCRFNRSMQYAVISTVASAINWYSVDDELLDAGMDGVATGRNIDINTSGEVILTRPRIGKTAGSGAAAAVYIRAVGSGTVKLIEPQFVGTPTTGIKEGVQAVKIIYERGDGGTIASAATITLPTFGDMFTISGTTSITSITATNCLGREITLVFSGALTFTDGSNLQLNANANFVTTADDQITLRCTGSNWIEISRSVN